MSTSILLASSPIFVLGSRSAKQGRARNEGAIQKQVRRKVSKSVAIMNVSEFPKRMAISRIRPRLEKSSKAAGTAARFVFAPVSLIASLIKPLGISRVVFIWKLFCIFKYKSVFANIFPRPYLKSFISWHSAPPYAFAAAFIRRRSVPAGSGSRFAKQAARAASPISAHRCRFSQARSSANRK